MWVASAFAKATHIFSAKILTYMQYLMIIVLMILNNIVSFEQLGPDLQLSHACFICIYMYVYMYDIDRTRSLCSFLCCVEVLRPCQPNGVMSSAVSLPNHTFTGQA